MSQNTPPSLEDRAGEIREVLDHKLRRGEISRREFVRLAVAFGLVAAAPFELSGPAAAARSADDSLRFLVGEAFWANWNSYGHTALIGFKIQRNIFDRLVEIQSDGKTIKPGLATSWRQIDPRTWEFRLGQGVTFHEGQQLTAEDVKASVELASGHSPAGKKLAMASMWGIPHSGQVVNDRTVRLIGNKPFGPLLFMLGLTDIRNAGDVAKGVKYLEKHPNGTGAFKVVGDTPNKKTLERFDGHYRGPAKLKTTEWEYIQDSQTRLNALLAGQAHVIDRVETDQLPLIASNKNARAMSITTFENQGIFLRNDKPPFKDNPALRRALFWGVDRQGVVKLVGGRAAVAVSHFPPIRYQVPQSPAYRFDPKRAQAEIKAAGATTPVEIELLSSVGFYPKSKEIAEFVTQNLNQSGFKVQLTLLELGAWIDALFGKQKQGNLTLGGWADMTGDADFAMSTLYHSPGAWDGMHDKTVDNLIDAGKVAATPSKRAAVYRQLQKYLWTSAPHIALFYSDLSNGVAANVRGLELYPTFVHDFWPVRFSA